MKKLQTPLITENDAIKATPKNKELIEKTNVDIKYQYKSPYVNDNPTWNVALKFDAHSTARLLGGRPAPIMSHLAKTNIKTGSMDTKNKSSEGFIYNTSSEKLPLDAYKKIAEKDLQPKHYLT